MALYEAVHARPDGHATVSRLARTAAAYGYDGIVIRNHSDELATYDADAVAETYGIDVVPGVEIRADDAAQASGLVGTHRDQREIVCLHGGSLNRFGVEHPRVDVLAHPMADGDVNHVLAQAATENGVRLEFNLHPVIHTTGSRRVTALRGLRKLADVVQKYDVPYVVSVDAASHLALRAPREVVALGAHLGLEATEVREGLREWGRVADRNRTRRADAFVEPGVSRDEHGRDDPEA